MKKDMVYRKLNHHICNLSFIMSSIILLALFISQVFNMSKSNMFDYLLWMNTYFIVFALAAFAVFYVKYKIFNKLEKVSSFMVIASVLILALSYLVETTLLH